MCKTSTDLYQLTLTYCMSCNSNLIGQKYQIQPKKKKYHLARCKNECSSFWFPDPHNNSSKTLQRFKR